MRCRGAARCSSRSRPPPCRPGCRPAFSSAGRTSGRPRGQLAAATARIGVAKADYFPRVLLTGSAGGGSVMVGGNWFGPTAVLGIGPQVTLPIFNMGRIGAGVASAEAQAQEALVRYQQAIQQAFREVSDAARRAPQAAGVPRPAGGARRLAARCGPAVGHPLPRRRDELPRGAGHRAPALRRRAESGADSARRAARGRAALPRARGRLDGRAASGGIGSGAGRRDGGGQRSERRIAMSARYIRPSVTSWPTRSCW